MKTNATTPEPKLGLAAYQCGCRVTGVQADPVKAIAYASGVNIEWCPTHAQAPAMLEALDSFLSLCEGRDLFPNLCEETRAILRAIDSDPKGR